MFQVSAIMQPALFTTVAVHLTLDLVSGDGVSSTPFPGTISSLEIEEEVKETGGVVREVEPTAFGGKFCRLLESKQKSPYLPILNTSDGRVRVRLQICAPSGNHHHDNAYEAAQCTMSLEQETADSALDPRWPSSQRSAPAAEFCFHVILSGCNSSWCAQVFTDTAVQNRSRWKNIIKVKHECSLMPWWAWMMAGGGAGGLIATLIVATFCFRKKRMHWYHPGSALPGNIYLGRNSAWDQINSALHNMGSSTSHSAASSQQSSLSTSFSMILGLRTPPWRRGNISQESRPASHSSQPPEPIHQTNESFDEISLGQTQSPHFNEEVQQMGLQSSFLPAEFEEHPSYGCGGIGLLTARSMREQSSSLPYCQEDTISHKHTPAAQEQHYSDVPNHSRVQATKKPTPPQRNFHNDQSSTAKRQRVLKWAKKMTAKKLRKQKQDVQLHSVKKGPVPVESNHDENDSVTVSKMIQELGTHDICHVTSAIIPEVDVISNHSCSTLSWGSRSITE